MATLSSRRRLGALAAALLLSCAGFWALRRPGSDAPAPGFAPHGTPRVERLRLPLAFEPNRGQAPDGVDFVARGPGYGLTVADAAVSLALRDGERSAHVRMAPVGAAPRRARTSERLSGHVNYLLGNDRSQWQEGVPTFGRVTYERVYPGVDLVYYGTAAGELEYDFRVAPGADPGIIELAFEGAETVAVEETGDLRIAAGGGEIRFRKPFSYQVIDGERREVPSRFVSREVPSRFAPRGETRIAFALDAYDPQRELVIDPVLLYGTYLGGSSDDVGQGIEVDSSGNLYLVGDTQSTDIPNATGSNSGARDAFITRINADGSHGFTTYYGGSADDSANDAAVDVNDVVHVTGFAVSSDIYIDAGTVGVGSAAVFVARFSNSGTLLTSYGLDGVGTDRGNAIAVDTTGNSYVVGGTASAPNTNNFEVTDGSSLNGASDAFVAKLDTTPSVVYSRRVGGSGDEDGYGIVVDAAGVAFITGRSSSGSDTFPTAGGGSSTHNGGGWDYFIGKVKGDGSGLDFSGLFGGSGNDEAQGIALSGGSDIAVVAHTTSTGLSTTSGAIQAGSGGSTDAYIAIYTASISPTYATYFGDTGDDVAYDCAFDSQARLAVSLSTTSDGLASTGAPQTTNGGGIDAFLAVVDPTPGELTFGTYYGGGANDVPYAVAVDGDDNYVLAGGTGSSNLATPGGFQTTSNGIPDAFVAVFSLIDPLVVTNTSSGGPGSLPYAIGYANNTTGTDTITFDIPTSDPNHSGGIWTLAPSAPLVVQEMTVLDGLSQAINQPGSTNSNGPEIQVTGGSLSTGQDLLTLAATAPGSVVVGLALVGAPRHGLVVEAANAQIRACHIGIGADGTTDMGNGGNGVVLNASDVHLGQTGAPQRTLVSGNAAAGVLLSSGADNCDLINLGVGVDITNNVDVGNDSHGIWLTAGASGNTLSGGTAFVDGNNISGNGGNGVRIEGAGTDGNLLALAVIGANATAAAALTNDADGVYVGGGAKNNTIGDAPNDKPVMIGGNTGYGVVIRDSGTTGNKLLHCAIGTNQLDATGVGNTLGGVSIALGATGNTIGGTGSNELCLISGNTGAGITLSGSATTGNRVLGCHIGTNLAGSSALPNTTAGIDVQAPGNTIGGTNTGEGNVLSGNSQYGIVLSGSGTTSNQVLGNIIGGNAAGDAKVTQTQVGVGLVSVSNNTIAKNTVIGNNGTGISITGAAGASGNPIVGNWIGTNAAGASGLGNGVGIRVVGTVGAHIIGGSMGGEGNTICSNTLAGIRFEDTNASHQVLGNEIGVLANGTPLPNGNGIQLGASTGTSNVTIGGSGSSERNIVSGNTQAGILLTAGSTGNAIDGNYIGVDPNGQVAQPNGTYGVRVQAGSNTNTIGVNAANVIAGNTGAGLSFDGSGTHSNVVQRNWIGTNANAGSLGNGQYGILIAGNAGAQTIGGSNPGEGNTIVGHSTAGIRLFNGGTNTVIRGNDIGVFGGATADPNGIGILVESASIYSHSGVTIGGAGVDDGNVISGNTTAGIRLTGQAPSSYPSGTLIDGNTLGLNAAEDTQVPNGSGILIEGASSTVIGGSARNTIAGNSTYGIDIASSAVSGTVIQRNLIGTNAAGAAGLGNGNGIRVTGGSGTQIGGSNPGEGNVVAGNSGAGIALLGAGSNTIVRGNHIGLVNGTTARGNANGLVVTSNVSFPSTGLVIGGSGANDGNVIAGSTQAGIRLMGAQTTGTLIDGNIIGLNAAATGTAPNTTGIVIESGAKDNLVGSLAGNQIGGNYTGIQITGAGTDQNKVVNNYIGLNAAGTGFGMPGGGVLIEGGASSNSIGADGSRNIIGNNNTGVGISGNGTDFNDVTGNYIGVAADGVTGIGNSTGVHISGGAAENVVGEAGSLQVISGSGGFGVVLLGAGTDFNEVLGNTIGGDAGGSGAVANGLGGVQIANGAQGNIVGDANGVEGNLIYGNGGPGVTITGSGTNANEVYANTIGTNAAAASGVGNVLAGVLIDDLAAGNRIGGSGSGLGNVISGNRAANGVGGDGVYVEGTGNHIAANRIGVKADGTTPLGNARHGIMVAGSAVDTLIDSDHGSLGNVIGANGGHGIYVTETSQGTEIYGSRIGIGADGTTTVANTGDGVRLDDGSNGSVIGAVTPSSLNVVSGNVGNGITLTGGASGNSVGGNRIGTNAAGDAARPNSGSGVAITGLASSNTVGESPSEGVALVISGNAGWGVHIGPDCTDNEVLGCYIGLSASGGEPVGNQDDGLRIEGSDTVVGSAFGTASRPYISGNLDNGIVVTGSGALNNAITGAFIGVDTSGSSAVGNSQVGIIVDGATGTTIGYTQADPSPSGYSVVVGGNAIGISIEGNPTRTTVSNTLVGVSSGLGAANTSHGLAVVGATTTTRIGGGLYGNAIAGNGGNGLQLLGATGVHVRGNSVFSNTGDGARVANSGAQVLLTQNTFSGNTGLGINLAAASDSGSTGNVTLNDSGDGDTGPNGLLNFPVIESAVYDAQQFQLTVTGYTRPGTRVGIYRVAPDPTGFGEGSEWLGDFVEGSADDSDATTGSYSGPINGRNQGADTTNRFRATIGTSHPLAGESLTAVGHSETGTDANGMLLGLTSEFSGLVPVTGPANQMAFTQQPSNATVHATIGTVQVTVRDGDGRTVTGFSGSVTLTLVDGGQTGAVLSGTKTVAANKGVATFSGLSVDKPGSYQLRASAGGVAQQTSNSFAVSAGAATAAASQLTASPTSVLADGQATTTLTVTLRDQYNNPVPNRSTADVALTASPSTGVTISALSGNTDSQGRVTATARSTSAAQVTFTARLGGTPLSTTAQVTFGATAPSAARSSLSASPASVTADGQSTAQLTLLLRDANNNPVPNTGVTLSVDSPTGVTLSPSQVTTNSSGQANATVKSTVAKTITVTADLGSQGSLTASVTFTAGAPADGTTELTTSPDPPEAVADGSTVVTLTLTARDANGNPLSGQAVTFSSDPSANVTMSVTQPTTDASGQATATVRSSVAQDVTVSASVGGVTKSVVVSFVTGSPTGNASTFEATPDSVTADGETAAALVFTLRDGSGNPVSGATVQFTASPTTGVTLSTTQATTDAAGQASATIRSSVAQDVTVTAQAVGVSKQVVVSFVPGSAADAQSSLEATPDSAPADGATAIDLAFALRDDSGNAVSGATVQFTASPATGVTISPAEATTDIDGNAAATVTSTQAGEVTLIATGGGVTKSLTVTFLSTDPDEAQSTLSVSPADGTQVADGEEAFTFTLIVRDAQGNAVSGVPVSFDAEPGEGVTLDTGAAVGSEAAATTDADGRAEVSMTSTKAGEVTLTATAGSGDATVTKSAAVTFVPGAVDAAVSTLTVDRGEALANRRDSVRAAVTALDSQGNPVPGAIVSLSVEGDAGGAVAVETEGERTGADGRVLATLTARRPVTVTLRAVVGEVTLDDAPTVAFGLPAVDLAESTVETRPERIAADGEEQVVVRVVLRDAAGQPIEGVTAADRSVAIERDGQATDALAIVSDSGTTGDDGAFELTATATEAGFYALEITVGEVTLPKALFEARAADRLILAEGLQFIGIPPLVPDADALPALPEGVQLARWDPATLSYILLGAGDELSSVLQPGVGLWALAPTRAELRFRGSRQDRTGFAWVLAEGWNALANPFPHAFEWRLDRISVGAAGATAGSLSDEATWEKVEPYAWVYDRANQRHRLVFDPRRVGFEGVQDSIGLHDAFWMKALSDDVGLRIEATPPAGRSAAPAAPGPRDWTVALVAEAGDATAAELVLGESTRLQRALRVDAPPRAEATGVTLTLVASDGRAIDRGRAAGGTGTAGEIRAAGADRMDWEIEARNDAEGEVTLSWPGLGRQAPRGLLLELTDRSTGRSLLLNTRASYRWTAGAGEVRRLAIRARRGHIERSAITGLSVQPGRGRGTQVALTLTGPADVTLTVRGLGGRVVAQWTEQVAAAGTVTLGWDGTDAQGRPVPRGTYTVEAVAMSANGAASRATRTILIQ